MFCGLVNQVELRSLLYLLWAHQRLQWNYLCFIYRSYDDEGTKMPDYHNRMKNLFTFFPQDYVLVYLCRWAGHKISLKFYPYNSHKKHIIQLY